MPRMTDLDPDEFRRHAHAVVDWIADYRAGLADRPVGSTVGPGWVRAQLPADLPETAQPVAALLDELDRVVLPASTHWQHPGFFGYFPANASLHSLLGDMLSGGLGAQGMLWSTSPAATEVEQVLLDGLAAALGLGREFTFGGGGGGSIQDSASSATLVALLAALHRTSGGAWRDTGVDGRERVYLTAETHSSVAKAARVAGLGARALHVVDPFPGRLDMSPDALAAALRADGAAGLRPTMVCATVGSTGTGAVDRLPRSPPPPASTGPGCTWTPHGPGWPRSAPSTAACSTGWSWPTRSAPTRTSGCSPRSTPRCCGCATGGRSRPRCRSPRSTCATRPASPARCWTTGTGRCRWAAGSARSSSGRWSAATGWPACASTSARTWRWPTSWPGGCAPTPGSRCRCRRRWPWSACGGSPVSGPEADDDATRGLLERVNASGRALLTHTVVDGRYLIRVAIGSVATRPGDVAALWQQLSDEAG